jgi:hypothetical protein
MLTSLPCNCFVPSRFLQVRFGPVFACYVNPAVDTFFSPSGLTFCDFLAAIGSRHDPPIRVINAAAFPLQSADAFLTDLSHDSRSAAQDFQGPDFEAKATAGEPSPEPPANPLWYQWLVLKAFESLRCQPYDFSDFPIAVIYVGMTGSPVIEKDDMIRRLSFPEWISQYFKVDGEILFARLCVYDATVHTSVPKDAMGKGGSYSQVFGLAGCSRPKAGPREVPRDFVDLFQNDAHLIKNPNLGEFITKADIVNAETLLASIYSWVAKDLEGRFMKLQKQFGDNQKIRAKLKTWMGKKHTGDSNHFMGVREKKINHIRLAAMYASRGQYTDARRLYKHFVSSMSAARIPSLEYTARLMAAFCCLGLPDKWKEFREESMSLVSPRGEAPTLSFSLSLILNIAELAIAEDQHEFASQFFLAGLQAIRATNLSEERLALLRAILLERLAGITLHRRHSWLYTGVAVTEWERTGLFGQALRGLIWLLGILPRNSWRLLYQSAWLHKVSLLGSLRQAKRALLNCKELISLPDLEVSLHSAVIERFWEPMNNMSPSEIAAVKMDSLLEVRSVQLIGPSFPEFWGFTEEEFAPLVRQAVAKFTTRRVDYETLWGRKEEVKETGPTMARVGDELRLLIAVRNRYTFPIQIESAYVAVSPESCQECHCEKTQKVQVPGLLHVEFECTFRPLAEGSFVIDSLVTNCWKYLTTAVKIGPLPCMVASQHPRLSISLENFPSRASAYDCHNFIVKITNDSEFPVDGAWLLPDSHQWVVPLTGHETGNSDRFVSISTIEPAQSVKIPFVGHFAEPGERSFRCLAGVGAVRCAFAVASCSVVQTLFVNCAFFTKPAETTRRVLRCTVRPLATGITVCGVIGRSGRLLRTLNAKAEALGLGQSFSLVAFPEEETDEALPPWRTHFLGKSECGLLFSHDGLDVPSQVNLTSPPSDSTGYYRFEVPPEVTEGQLFRCRFISEANTDLFVEVLPAILVLPGKAQFAGFDWLGVTRKQCCERTGFRAEFLARAPRPGIFTIQGVKIYHGAADESGSLVPIARPIAVVPAVPDRS